MITIICIGGFFVFMGGVSSIGFIQLKNSKGEDEVIEFVELENPASRVNLNGIE